jgi:hypothetical protein
MAMCYEERYFDGWATKKERQRDQPAARGERPAPQAQPGRSAPERQKPKQPEPELEPV